MTETPSDFEGCSVHEGGTWRERTLGCEVWAGTVTCLCSSGFWHGKGRLPHTVVRSPPLLPQHPPPNLDFLSIHLQTHTSASITGPLFTVVKVAWGSQKAS